MITHAMTYDVSRIYTKILSVQKSVASPTGHGPQPGASADCAIPKLRLPRTTAGTSKMLWDAKCARNFGADFSLDVHFWSEHPKKALNFRVT